MASRYQIQMDFNRTKQKAQELDNIANQLARLAGTNFQNTLTALNSDWKGDNATAYIANGYALIENMTDTVGKLRNAANSIRKIAQNIYNAEMEALRIAEERAAAEQAKKNACEVEKPNHGGGSSRKF